MCEEVSHGDDFCGSSGSYDLAEMMHLLTDSRPEENILKSGTGIALHGSFNVALENRNRRCIQAHHRWQGHVRSLKQRELNVLVGDSPYSTEQDTTESFYVEGGPVHKPGSVWWSHSSQPLHYQGKSIPDQTADYLVKYTSDVPTVYLEESPTYYHTDELAGRAPLEIAHGRVSDYMQDVTSSNPSDDDEQEEHDSGRRVNEHHRRMLFWRWPKKKTNDNEESVDNDGGDTASTDTEDEVLLWGGSSVSSHSLTSDGQSRSDATESESNPLQDNDETRPSGLARLFQMLSKRLSHPHQAVARAVPSPTAGRSMFTVAGADESHQRHWGGGHTTRMGPQPRVGTARWTSLRDGGEANRQSIPYKALGF